MSKGMGKKECGGKRRVQNQVLGLFKGWPYQLPIWPHLAKPKICLRHELYHIPEWIQNNVKHQLHRARSLKWLMRLQFSRKKNIREVRISTHSSQSPSSVTQDILCIWIMNYWDTCKITWAEESQSYHRGVVYTPSVVSPKLGCMTKRYRRNQESITETRGKPSICFCMNKANKLVQITHLVSDSNTGIAITS